MKFITNMIPGDTSHLPTTNFCGVAPLERYHFKAASVLTPVRVPPYMLAWLSVLRGKTVFQYADTQKGLGHSPKSTKIRHSRRPYVEIRRKKRLFGIRATHHQVPVVESPVHSRYVKERIVRSTSRNCRLVKFNQSQRL